MIRKYNFWPLYEVAKAEIQQSFQNFNLYCEPTPFKAWAKISIHRDTGLVKERENVLEGLHVASCQIAASNDNLTDLVDIPDVVGDISKIQPLLISQKDPAKMLIWMEVFKRSVIKARPIRPFVKVCEMLPVADCR